MQVRGKRLGLMQMLYPYWIFRRGCLPRREGKVVRLYFLQTLPSNGSVIPSMSARDQCALKSCFPVNGLRHCSTKGVIVGTSGGVYLVMASCYAPRFIGKWVG